MRCRSPLIYSSSLTPKLHSCHPPLTRLSLSAMSTHASCLHYKHFKSRQALRNEDEISLMKLQKRVRRREAKAERQCPLQPRKRMRVNMPLDTASHCRSIRRRCHSQTLGRTLLIAP
jgi:hypothetical protein